MGKNHSSIFSISYTCLLPLVICVLIIASSAENSVPTTEEKLYQQCKRLFSGGKFAEAGVHIERFRSSYPQSGYVGEINFMRAFLQPAIGDSVEMYRAIIEKYPDSKWAAKAHFQLGQCYYLQGEYDKALDRYGKIIVSYPEDEVYWLARYWKCRSLIARGDYEKAMIALRSLKESDFGQVGEDMILMAMGNCYLAMKDYESAAVLYRSLIDSLPDSQRIPSAYLLLAKSLQNLGKPDDAKKLYQKVIESYRQSIEARQARKYLNSLSAPQPKTVKPPTKSASYFTIRVGAFSSKRNADNLAGRLRKKGYSVSIIPPASGKSRLYRVIVGKFKTRSGALKSARRLSENEELDTAIARY